MLIFSLYPLRGVPLKRVPRGGEALLILPWIKWMLGCSEGVPSLPQIIASNNGKGFLNYDLLIYWLGCLPSEGELPSAQDLEAPALRFFRPFPIFF